MQTRDVSIPCPTVLYSRAARAVYCLVTTDLVLITTRVLKRYYL